MYNLSRIFKFYKNYSDVKEDISRDLAKRRVKWVIRQQFFVWLNDS